MSVQAYTYQLGTREVNSENVVQHMAGWMIGVIPLSHPDTFRFTSSISSAEAVSVRRPFVIESDCVQVRVVSSKATPFGSCEVALKSGDINYLGAIFPGDFIFVWMHVDRAKIQDVKDRFLAKKPANDFDSGLKFMGRVEAIRENLSIVNPTVGTKSLNYLLTATGFQEFNTKVYIVPFLTLAANEGFFQLLIDKWYQLLGRASDVKGATGCQAIVKTFLNMFMGAGPKSIKAPANASPNEAFLVPKEVGFALGRIASESKAPTIKFSDILTFIQGVQRYSITNDDTKPLPEGQVGPSEPLWPGLIPDLSSKVVQNVRQYETPIPCTGTNLTYGQKWQDTTVWSILNQYLNSSINEMYTAMRVGPEGTIVPTLIMRQIPFSTEEFLKRDYGKGGAAIKPKPGTPPTAGLLSKVTLFMNLPRWKPHSAMVINHDIGRSNALRVNYVQVWGEMAGGPGIDSKSTGSGGDSTSGFVKLLREGGYQMTQNELGNKTLDGLDIRRSGLRSYVVTVPFDFPDADRASKSPIWARWMGDWLINGHLKTSGTITLTGVSEPICVGDNFEWNGIVSHIEQVTHTAQIAPNGQISFRTTLALSNGLSVKSGATTIYPYMDNMFRETLAAQDRERDGIYPGYTDVEVIENRPSGEPVANRVSPDLEKR